MNKQDTFNYKLNSKGEIDLDYYLDLGHQLRAEHLGSIFSDMKAWFSSHLNFHWLKGSFARLAHH